MGVETEGDIVPDVDAVGGGGDEGTGEKANEKAVSCNLAAICFVDVGDGLVSILRRRNFPDVPGSNLVLVADAR